MATDPAPLLLDPESVRFAGEARWLSQLGADPSFQEAARRIEPPDTAQVRRRLLAGSVRLTEAMAPDAVEAARAAAERLGVSGEIELYQRAGDENASIHFVDDAVILEVQGRMLTLLDRPSSLALYGHELGHRLAHGPHGEYGRAGILARVLVANLADGPLRALASRFAMAQEITADRFGLLAAGDEAAPLRLSMAATTGLPASALGWDTEAYVAQCRDTVEAIRKGDTEVVGSTHPEHGLRTYALWRFAQTDRYQELTGRGPGSLPIAELEDELVKLFDKGDAALSVGEEVLAGLAHLHDAALACAALVALADGELGEQEADAIERVFAPLVPDWRWYLVWDNALQRFREVTPLLASAGHDTLRALVGLLTHVTAADGTLTQSEVDMIVAIGDAIGRGTVFRALLPPVLRSLGESHLRLDGGAVALPLSARADDVDAALTAFFGGLARRGGGSVAVPRLLRLAGLSAWDDDARRRIGAALTKAELLPSPDLATIAGDGVLELALSDEARERREADRVASAPREVALPPDTTEREHLRNALVRLRDRLVSGDGRSPSVRMYTCRAGRSFDLLDLDRISNGHGERTLALLRAGQRARLVDAAEAGSHEGAAAVADALRLLDREQRARQDETGADDLALGWPFVAGVVDGYLFRAPLLLLPVAFEVDNRGARSFALVRTEDPPTANHALLRLLFRRKGFALPDDLVDRLDERAAEGPEALIKAIEELGIPLRARPSELRRLGERADEFAKWTGSFFEVEECAVVGLFPQSGSDILQDYDRLLSELADPAKRPADVLGCALEILPANLREALRAGEVLEADVAEVAPVAASDPSQIDVVRASRRERALVVDGPPGTGKSQTIVNLVADALVRGKSVAVVCEKRAAVDVVAQRLEGLGLGHLLAVVHDVHHDRRVLFQRIVARLATQADGAGPATVEDLRAERDTLVAELAGRHATRHVVREGPGCSLDALHVEAACLDVPPLRAAGPHPDAGALARVDRAQRDAWLRHLAELRPWADLAASASPWAGIHDGKRVWVDDVDLDARLALGAAVEAAAVTADAVAAARAPLADIDLATLDRARPALGAARAAREARADDVTRRRFAQLLRRTEGEPEILDRCEAAVAAWSKERVAALAVATPVEARPTPALTAALPVVTRWSGSFFRFFVFAWWQGRSAIRTWLAGAWPERAAAVVDGGLADAIRERVAASAAWDVALSLADTLQVAPPADAKAADAWMTWLGRAVPLVRDLLDHRSALRAAAAWPEGPDAEAWTAHDARVELLDGAARALEAHRAALAPVRARFPGLADGESGDSLRALAAAWERDGARLVEHDRRVRAAERLLPATLPLLRALADEHGAAPATRWTDVLRRAWAEAWIARLEREDARVRQLDQPTAFGTEPAAAARLAEIGKRLATLEVDRIRAAADQRELLTAAPAAYRKRRTDVQAAREQMLKEASKQRYVLPLRTFVRTFAGQGLLDVLPVWLLSPETMTVLFEGRAHFDLAILDEASQCTVEAGLPVLTRARRVVIAGDDKQMPPTSFFEGSAALEEEDAPVSTGGDGLMAESLLVLARDRVARAPLRWHYRCHDEELIAFSNHAMYGGNLLTIPSTATPRARPALRWIPVPDGAYDGGANPSEARRVVDLLDELLAEDPTRSIGVVTFNLQQRKSVLDAIDARRASDPAFAERYDRAAADARLDNRPFVKNLEAVQGDERDVIVFSLGHAPIPRRGRKGADTELYVPARFGPLGLVGGERRLNVAISRARRLCCVVCSFEPEQLSVAGSQNDGPKLLKAWLEYAWALHRGERVSASRILDRVREDGPARRADGAGKGDVVPLQVQIARALSRDGLLCEVDVGSSGFRVPLAVADAKDAERFRVAVLVDPPDAAAQDARVLVPAVLATRGWRCVHVDARRWHRAPAEVLDAIRAALAPPADIAADTPDASAEPIAPSAADDAATPPA